MPEIPLQIARLLTGQSYLKQIHCHATTGRYPNVILVAS